MWKRVLRSYDVALAIVCVVLTSAGLIYLLRTYETPLARAKYRVERERDAALVEQLADSLRRLP